MSEPKNWETMEGKKISFGFSKVKKPIVLSTNNIVKSKKDDIEMIEEIEGQTIKIIG